MIKFLVGVVAGGLLYALANGDVFLMWVVLLACRAG